MEMKEEFPDSVMKLSNSRFTQREINESWSQNKIQLIRGGKEYFELLLTLINSASESIHLQTYIFNNDETGSSIAEALKSASRRNVSVYLLADGYASKGLTKKIIDQLLVAGVHFRFFEPIFKSNHFYLGRRLHHKVFVADAKFSLVGGINIADRYNDMPDKCAWLDFSLYIEGPIASSLCFLCRKTWNNLYPKKGMAPCEERQIIFDFKQEETSLIRLRQNDWVRHKNEISTTYIEMLRHCHSHITIMCSYFIPGKILRRLLENAANRGVKIKVITAGQSDVILAKLAERWMYDWLLRNKIEVYEYQSTILHAKVAICDSTWMTIGSYNLNDISTYASIELNIDVNNFPFVQKVEQLIDTIIRKECVPITRERHLKSKNIFKQFSRWLSYKVFSIIFNILTFYYKQSKI